MNKKFATHSPLWIVFTDAATRSPRLPLEISHMELSEQHPLIGRTVTFQTDLTSFGTGQVIALDLVTITTVPSAGLRSIPLSERNVYF
ncbi:hypothetical protein D3C75_969320 [compost metagenome]